MTEYRIDQVVGSAVLTVTATSLESFSGWGDLSNEQKLDSIDEAAYLDGQDKTDDWDERWPLIQRLNKNFVDLMFEAGPAERQLLDDPERLRAQVGKLIGCEDPDPAVWRDAALDALRTSDSVLQLLRDAAVACSLAQGQESRTTATRAWVAIDMGVVVVRNCGQNAQEARLRLFGHGELESLRLESASILRHLADGNRGDAVVQARKLSRSPQDASTSADAGKMEPPAHESREDDALSAKLAGPVVQARKFSRSPQIASTLTDARKMEPPAPGSREDDASSAKLAGPGSVLAFGLGLGAILILASRSATLGMIAGALIGVVLLVLVSRTTSPDS